MTDPKPTVVVVGTSASNMRMLGAAGPCAIKDPIMPPAVLSGPHGRAWQVDLVEQRRKLAVDARDDAQLAHWLIEAPGAHPLWHSYSLVLIHLRPLRRGARTIFYRDDATHELWLMAIDPDAERSRMMVDGLYMASHWLQPKNFAAQIAEPDDEHALARIEAATRAICEGRLNPDTDYISSWVALFGDSMMRNRPDAVAPDIKESFKPH